MQKKHCGFVNKMVFIGGKKKKQQQQKEMELRCVLHFYSGSS